MKRNVSWFLISKYSHFKLIISSPLSLKCVPGRIFSLLLLLLSFSHECLISFYAISHFLPYRNWLSHTNTHTHTQHIVHNLESSTRRTNMKTFSATKRIFRFLIARQSLISLSSSTLSICSAQMRLSTSSCAKCMKMQLLDEASICTQHSTSCILPFAFCILHNTKVKAAEVGQLRESHLLAVIVGT